MSLDQEQLNERMGAYKFDADLAGATLRHVAMLGMMACCAASWMRLVNMPAEWGWARAVCPLIPEIAPRTPTAKNE